MKELSMNEIKNRWMNKQWRSEDSFNLYIDSPMCIKFCNYCIYSPTVTQINSPIYKRYYEEYLPSLIKEFTDIMKSRQIDTIYFGGGTSSLMTIDIMKRIFESIPNFEKIPNKVFENHPAFTTKEKIDLLGDYKFSYLSFGVQSLNEDVIAGQNRIHFKKEKFKELIKRTQERGMCANTDLLAFMETGTVEDLKTFEEDLYVLTEEYSPNIVTIFPMYQRLNLTFDKNNTLLYDNAKQMEHNYELISQLRRILIKFNRKSKMYKISDLTTPNLDREEIIHNAKTNYFAINITEEEFRKVKKYSSSGYPHQPPSQNVLALGGMGDRTPYSYHGRDFLYFNKNDNWTPKFYEQ